jgi:mitochondrial import receptor subunit TOM40
MLEKRVAPAVTLTFVGDVDHFKNQAKLGFSVSIESATEAIQAIQEKAALSGTGPTTPSVPF